MSALDTALDKLIEGMTALRHDGRFDEPNLDGTPGDYISFSSWEWPQGVGLYGLAQLWRSGRRPALKSVLEDWYAGHLAAGLPPLNVNTTAPMLALSLLARETGDPAQRAALDAWADRVLTEAPRTEERAIQHDVSDKKNPGELWDDTLFMVGLFLANHGVATGRADLVAEARHQFAVHARYLTDPETGLWFHGFTFDGRHNFARARWARGNAWISAAIVDLMELGAHAGPDVDLGLDELKAVLVRQVEALLPLQTESGAWRTLLDDPSSYEEMSATAGFGYALMKAARLGLGDGRWLRAGLRARDAVLAAIDESGTLQGVSYGTRMGHDLQFYRDIPLQPTAYGQAMALLCLAEALEHESAGDPLRPGEALTYFVLGKTHEARFDVPDQPMSGEMDPFFFVTKTKNFIPHEYPCRTAFAARRGTMPEPVAPFAPASNRLPFGAERVDLSGFWFRPTVIATWARTRIVSPGGEARFRLTTPGAATLYVDDTPAGFLAPYSRNLEAETEITVTLPAGHATLSVYFDDLAERDTRHLFRLDWLGGAEVRPVFPYAARAETVRAVEATLNAMHFDRPSYSGGEVRIVLPVPLPADATATITVEGDFMSHETIAPFRAEIPAGADAFAVCDAADVRADFRHFAVEIAMDGFTAARVLGVEITRGERGAAPKALGERIVEALDTIATGAEADTVTALARLATGRADATTEAMIEATLGSILDCWDCADFTLVPLLWSRILHKDALSPELTGKIDEAILGYRYWMDEPGNDVQWYFSENHALLFHTAAYIAGHHFPDATFVRSGRSGAAQSEVGRTRVRAWLDHFEAWEMAEFNSAPYFPIDLKGLTALFALAPDADIRARAGKGIARLVELVANSAHQGVLTGAQGRSYEHTLRAAASLELSAIARLLWGKGTIGGRVHALPQLAICLRDHGLSLPDLTERAVLTDDSEQEWFFKQGENGFAALAHAKTRDWALGTAARYRWFDWGYQETLLHARIGTDPQAQTFINHPGEVIHSGYGRPSYWGGSASVPRVQQYRGLAIAVFRGVEGQPDFTHAWFPRAAFDASAVEGTRATATQAGGALLLAASGPLQEMRDGPSANAELRLAGRDGIWLVRVGRGPHDAFARRFAALAAPAAADGTIVVNDPEYGPVTFHADGVVEAEGRRIDPAGWTIEGARRVEQPVVLS